MERSRKLLVIGSLFLVALALLYNNKHGKGNQQSLFHSGYSKYLIRISQRSTVNPSEDQVVDQVIPYNQFYLVEQWPETVCRFSTNRNCTTKPRKFTIHGLWPQNTTAWPSTNCCGWNTTTMGPKPPECNYNNSAISPTLRASLGVTWPNLFGNNTGFWGYEWEKHGACSEEVVSQTNYFQRANDLYNATGYNFFQILERAGIIPNNSASYSVTHIENVIRTGTRLNVTVNCHLDRSQNISYLKELYVCVNRNATNFENCNSARRCRAQAIFPAP